MAIPKIVCFGDSLTAGYQAPTIARPVVRETPYGARLQQRLGSGVSVVISGVCGERTGEMVERFQRAVVALRPAAVVLLGGTNDLGWGAAPADIVKNLSLLYELALASGIEPVAVTVPSIRAGSDEGRSEEARSWLAEHIAKRRELNRLIVDYCAQRGLSCVDLFAATSEPETDFLAEAYSNDGLHLTTAGYDLLAELLYEEVFRASAKLSRRSG